MRVFAISDLHISSNQEKPMDIFGDNWKDHLLKIEKNWLSKILPDDVVLIPGDISWAKSLEDAKIDLMFFDKLPGKKIIIKGNHDYWWNSYAKVKSILPSGMFAIQNNAIKIENKIFCGTRGWQVPEVGEKLSENDEKILKREEIRLELSLSKAAKLREQEEKIFVLMHYPPFNSIRQSSKFTSLLKKYEVYAVVYGHLHGTVSLTNQVIKKDEISYFLVSTDMINHDPVLIDNCLL
ncbi:MAG TPA: serine/threonine protein phosphatase [Clostridiales bacterium]|nr:serine/threonine protein phosphatase [Clostridiales bacterium]